jgi:hypothetical protein
MPLMLIPIVWLVVVTLLVALCRMAARADTGQVSDADRRQVGDGPRLFSDPLLPGLAIRLPSQNTTRRRQARPPLRRGRPTRKRRVAAHVR